MSDPKQTPRPAACDDMADAKIPGDEQDRAKKATTSRPTMPGRHVVRLLKARAVYGLLLFAATAIAAVPAHAQGPINLLPAVNDNEVCLQNILIQEQQHRIPVGLLTAIGLTESGRSFGNGHRTVWPWTVNAAGEGHFFESKKDAIAFVQEKQAAGTDSIDVGCMQVNLKHHPDAFASLDDAFDPATNVAYAADFLTSLRAELNSWIGAARRYHSATPELGDAYGEIVLANWTGPAKQQELTASAAAPTVVADIAPTTAQTRISPAPGAGFLSARPPQVAPTAGLSLFSQFYNPAGALLPRASLAPPNAGAAAAGGKATGFVSFQKLVPHPVIPGQTGLSLQDYRLN